MLVVRVRIFENDDVASFQPAVRKHLLVPRSAAAEDEFVDEQMVADQQCPFHRGGGYFERLNDKAGSEQGQKDGHQQRLQVLGYRRRVVVVLFFLVFSRLRRCHGLFDFQRSLFWHSSSVFPFHPQVKSVPGIPSRSAPPVAPLPSLCCLRRWPCVLRRSKLPPETFSDDPARSRRTAGIRRAAFRSPAKIPAERTCGRNPQCARRVPRVLVRTATA